jgi:hypothetical protein
MKEPDELAFLANGGIGPMAGPNERLAAEDAIEQLRHSLDLYKGESQRWLAWSGDSYPDDSPGDVISAEADGTVILDDSVTTWNPLRALEWYADRLEAVEKKLEASSEAKEAALAELSTVASQLKEARESKRLKVAASLAASEEASTKRDQAVEELEAMRSLVEQAADHLQLALGRQV